MMKKFDLALCIGLGCMLLFWLLHPDTAYAWWSCAFEPLCDGILTAESGTQDIVVRSKLLELLAPLL